MISPLQRSYAGIALAAALVFPMPSGSWLGADKIKHFLMSAFVQSAAFSITRAAGGDRATSHVAGALTSATAGVWKEMHDRRVGKPFSVPDLLWDAAGAASMAALLNRTR